MASRSPRPSAYSYGSSKVIARNNSRARGGDSLGTRLCCRVTLQLNFPSHVFNAHACATGQHGKFKSRES